ncbi:MAG: hypothetical protein M1497_15860 [Nitrospirae bacterium]|nr:hypothetical protein [Nitrospirota bacterium]
MNSYARLIPRLNGTEIEERFGYYLGLVEKGVAGFIVFGGELETVRGKLRELQEAAGRTLIIASDLEQGLGQQIRGGTLFPPAMAIASALRGLRREKSRDLLAKLYAAFAAEATYAGINTILAPVLDINTNPDNPIIATRAFGEDPDTVSFFGCEMIKSLQRGGIRACGKHFPGHGDTETDSHIGLPVIKKDLPSLEKEEFVSFKRAVTEQVDMIMLGHLSVPALDPSGAPASLSQKVISYLREKMGFDGLLMTDAMNMGALGGRDENEASLTALDAGADIILHPSDCDATAAYLKEKGWIPGDDPALSFHKGIRSSAFTDSDTDFDGNRRFSGELARMAVAIEGRGYSTLKRPFILILIDERSEKGDCFVRAMKRRYLDIGHCFLVPGDAIPWSAIPADHELVAAVFSQVRAWKGRSEWLSETIRTLEGKARLFISFGNPYLLRNVKTTTKIYAYWDSDSAQEAAAEKILR